MQYNTTDIVAAIIYEREMVGIQSHFEGLLEDGKTHPFCGVHMPTAGAIRHVFAGGDSVLAGRARDGHGRCEEATWKAGTAEDVIDGEGEARLWRKCVAKCWACGNLGLACRVKVYARYDIAIGWRTCWGNTLACT